MPSWENATITPNLTTKDIYPNWPGAPAQGDAWS